MQVSGDAAAPAADAGAAPRTVRVWDPLVRLFHWGVVTGVVLNLFILRKGKVPHRYVGYAIALLLLIRVVWGFIGTRHARFADFVRGPTAVRAYLADLWLKREKRHLGHNPAGGAMMLALMVLLATLCLSGWMMTLDAFWGVEWVEEVHELLSNALYLFVPLHVAGAVMTGYRHRENLILAMITGRKRA